MYGVRKRTDDGLIHGGFDPETILIDREGTVGVSDWELTVALAEHRDPSPYDAPEQVEGTETDERTDVHRLGATAYFVAIGETPTDISPDEIDRTFRRTDPTLPRALRT